MATEFEGQLVLCPVMIEEDAWGEAVMKASDSIPESGGNLRYLSNCFEPCIWRAFQGYYRLTFKTQRTGYDCCGTEAPTEVSIRAIQALGAKYGMCYVRWVESEKGYGDFYFLPTNAKGVGGYRVQGHYTVGKDGRWEHHYKVSVFTMDGEYLHDHGFATLEKNAAEAFAEKIEKANLDKGHFERSAHWEKIL